MEHEDLQCDVPALLASRLDEAGRLRLEAHLEVCQSCADTVSVGREILKALREGGEALWTEHPSVSEIRGLATGAASAGWGRFAAHLAVCPTCTLEIETWRARRSTAQTRHHPRAGSGASPAWIRPLLAGLAAGLILGLAPAAWWMNRGAGRRPAIMGGAPPWVQLDLPSRRESPTATVGITDEPFVLLLVPAEFSRGGNPEARFSIEILDHAGRVAWSAELSSEVLAERIDAGSSLLPLLVPTESLPAGACELKVRALPGGPEPLLRIPFAVRR